MKDHLEEDMQSSRNLKRLKQVVQVSWFFKYKIRVDCCLTGGGTKICKCGRSCVKFDVKFLVF